MQAGGSFRENAYGSLRRCSGTLEILDIERRRLTREGRDGRLLVDFRSLVVWPYERPSRTADHSDASRRPSPVFVILIDEELWKVPLADSFAGFIDGLEDRVGRLYLSARWPCFILGLNADRRPRSSRPDEARRRKMGARTVEGRRARALRRSRRRGAEE
jgi:hypothetical protein